LPPLALCQVLHDRVGFLADRTTCAARATGAARAETAFAVSAIGRGDALTRPAKRWVKCTKKAVAACETPTKAARGAIGQGRVVAPSIRVTTGFGANVMVQAEGRKNLARTITALAGGAFVIVAIIAALIFISRFVDTLTGLGTATIVGALVAVFADHSRAGVALAAPNQRHDAQRAYT